MNSRHEHEPAFSGYAPPHDRPNQGVSSNVRRKKHDHTNNRRMNNTRKKHSKLPLSLLISPPMKCGTRRFLGNPEPTGASDGTKTAVYTTGGERRTLHNRKPQNSCVWSHTSDFRAENRPCFSMATVLFSASTRTLTCILILCLWPRGILRVRSVHYQHRLGGRY